ncbi:phosphatase [Pantoea phage Phynn]|nr:phosphatase [Pantoea phage Phynn]
MKKLFDMDGVLFDWETAFVARFGMRPEDMSEEIFQSAKEEISNSDFYENLEPIEEGFALFLEAAAKGEAAILTSVGKYNSEGVADQKRKSLVRVLGYLPEFYYTRSSKEKAEYARIGTLYDDRLKSVVPFREAGGKAVLFVKNETKLAA